MLWPENVNLIQDKDVINLEEVMSWKNFKIEFITFNLSKKCQDSDVQEIVTKMKTTDINFDSKDKEKVQY